MLGFRCADFSELKDTELPTPEKSETGQFLKERRFELVSWAGHTLLFVRNGIAVANADRQECTIIYLTQVKV
jgi:hypothetical protein